MGLLVAQKAVVLPCRVVALQVVEAESERPDAQDAQRIRVRRRVGLPPLAVPVLAQTVLHFLGLIAARRKGAKHEARNEKCQGFSRHFSFSFSFSICF